MHQGRRQRLDPPPPGRHLKAKGKHADRKTGDRFAVLNTFADFTMAGLARAEIAGLVAVVARY